MTSKQEMDIVFSRPIIALWRRRRRVSRGLRLPSAREARPRFPVRFCKCGGNPGSAGASTNIKKEGDAVGARAREERTLRVRIVSEIFAQSDSAGKAALYLKEWFCGGNVEEGGVNGHSGN